MPEKYFHSVSELFQKHVFGREEVTYGWCFEFKGFQKQKPEEPLEHLANVTQEERLKGRYPAFSGEPLNLVISSSKREKKDHTIGRVNLNLKMKTRAFYTYDCRVMSPEEIESILQKQIEALLLGN